jgi:hypothetical protein
MVGWLGRVTDKHVGDSINCETVAIAPLCCWELLGCLLGAVGLLGCHTV